MLALALVLLAIGLVVLAILVVGARGDRPPTPTIADRAAPYRDGLQVAARLQLVADDLERQMYEAALEQWESDGGASFQERPGSGSE